MSCDFVLLLTGNTLDIFLLDFLLVLLTILALIFTLFLVDVIYYLFIRTSVSVDWLLLIGLITLFLIILHVFLL